MIRKTTRSILSVLLVALLLVTSIPLTPAFADGGGTVSPQSASGEGSFAGGTGTANDPYQIATAEELRDFAKLVNGGETDADAKLMNDIDLSSVCGESNSWTPIGSDSNEYTGTFDGNGKTISGLYINSSRADYQGLFGYLSTDADNIGTVQNLTVSGSVKGDAYVGGVVGYNNGGTVTGCTFSGSGSVSGSEYVGGVVGDNRGTVENCYNTGSVTSSGSPVGGVVGYNDSGGSVTNCYNTGTVTGTDDYVGGVVGYNRGTVTGCYFLKQNGMNESLQGIGDGVTDGQTANSVTTLDALCDALVSDTTTWSISPFYEYPVLKANPEGGLGTATHPYEIKTIDQLKTFRDIVNGANNQTADPDAHAKLMNDIDLEGNEKNQWTPIGNFINSYEGTFDGNGKTISGLYIDSSTNDQGLFGCLDQGGTVKDLSVSGNVSGDMYVGGVVGYNNGGTVTGCIFSGSGSVSGDRCVGGVVGQNYRGSVENCYNTGAVNSSGSRYVGGVVGDNYHGTVENCYNTGEVSGDSTGSDVGGVVGLNDGSVKNCYFLQTTEVNDKLQGIGGDSGASSNVEPRTADAFHSGEVAWLLQAGQTDGSSQVWGQSNLKDKNSWPTLIALDNSAQTVYKVITDYGYVEQPNNVSYTNKPATPSETPSRKGYTFGGWQKTTGEGNTITYTAKWTAEEPPYTGKYSYEVSTSVGDHGTLAVDRYATEGEKVTIDVTPDQAYKLDDLSVTANGKDVELTANSDGTYTFTMPSADVKISATFAEDPDWTEPEEPTTDVSDLFIDIARDAWYKDAVQYAYDNGLMTGVSATEFAPEATTTRAMIVSILARLEGVTTAQAAGFADVDDNDWYATAVNWAANVGVVNGYEDNTFQPNTAITREQLAAILMNYAAYKGEDVSNRASLATYTDQPSTWAEEAMQWAVAEGLITGVTADTLQPQGAATRAQVAAILQRFLSE